MESALGIACEGTMRYGDLPPRDALGGFTLTESGASSIRMLKSNCGVLSRISFGRSDHGDDSVMPAART